LKKGFLFLEKKFKMAIIRVLGDLGGQTPISAILSKVKMAVEEFNTPFWIGCDDSGHVRWKHRILKP
jgi:hypothetical protein